MPLPNPDVKFFRPFYGPQSKKGPTSGQDVLAFKWVLIRAGLMAAPRSGMPDPVFNRNAVEATKKLQAKAGILPKSGNVGPATFNASKVLKRKGTKDPAWDVMRVQLYNDAVDDMTVPTDEDVRTFVSQQLYIMYQNRARLDYSQARPVWALVNRVANPALARRIDCSGTSIYGGALADWHFRGQGIVVPPYDPTYGNSGYGNTWSLVKGGRRVTRGDTRVGDLVFYNGHVATIVNRRGDSVNVVSMGSNSGPLYLPDNYRSDIQQYRTYDLYNVVN